MISYLEFIKHIVFYGSSKFMQKFFGLLIFPLVARYLTPSEFGVFSVISSFTAWLVILCTFGGASPIVRYFSISGDEEEKKNLVSTWLLWNAAVLVFFACVVFAAKRGASVFLLKDGSFALLVMLGVAWSFVNYFIDICAQIIRFSLKPKLFSALQTGYAFFTSLLVVVFLFFRLSVLGYLLANLVSSLVFVFIYLYAIREFLIFRIDKALLSKMLAYGFPLVPSMALWAGMTIVDRVMLARTSSAEAGIYSAALKVVMAIDFFNIAFGMAWSPIALERYKKSPDHAPRFYGKVLYLYVLSLASVSIVISAFSREILYILTPGAYWSASAIIGLLTLCTIFNGTTYITQLAFAIKEKTRMMIIPPLLAFFFNITLNYVLIPYFGKTGAAAASAVSYFLLALSYGILGQRIYPIELRAKKMFGILGLYVAGTTAIAWFSSFSAGLLPARIAVLSVFFALCFLFRLIPWKSLSKFMLMVIRRDKRLSEILI